MASAEDDSDDIPEFNDGIDRYSGPADNGVSAEAQETMYRYLREHAPIKPWTAVAKCKLDNETGRQAIRALTLDWYVMPNADGDLRIDERHH